VQKPTNYNRDCSRGFLAGRNRLLTTVLILWLFAFALSVPAPAALLAGLQVTTHPDIDLSPRVSPDGKWVAYVNRQAANYDIWVTNVKGGRSYQITFNKADDLYPTWGPDSRTLVFVSQRSDAAGDIYLLKLREAGDQLIPKGQPEQITTYRGYDSYPTMSPDGKKIAWVSDRSGQDEIWFFNYNTGKTLQLTYLGGTHPVWSPLQDLIAFSSFRGPAGNQGDIYIIHLKGSRPTPADAPVSDDREYPTYRLTHGQALDGFPSWSSDATAVVFLRYDTDTNSDGTVSPADRGVIWLAAVNRTPQAVTHQDSLSPDLRRSFNLRMVKNAYPLAWSVAQQIQPWGGSDGRVYYSSDEQGNFDVWSIPIHGRVPRADSHEEQFSVAQDVRLPAALSRDVLGPLFLAIDAESLSTDEQKQLWDRALAFRRVIDFHGLNHALAVNALYEESVCLLLLGHYEEASSGLQMTLQRSGNNRSIAAYAELALLRIRTLGADEQKRNSLLRQGLASISRTFADQERPSAEARIAIGELYRSEGQMDDARKYYSAVCANFPQLRGHCAESLFRIAQSLQQQGGRQTTIEAYRRVLKEYPDQDQWAKAARQAILAFWVDSDQPVPEQQKKLRALIQTYPNDTLLVARARLQLADLTFQQHAFDQALTAYRSIEQDFPGYEESLIAQIAQAQCLFKLNKTDQGYEHLIKVIDSNKSARLVFAEQARTALVQSLLAAADEFKALQEFDLARARYQRAIEVDPHCLHGHRGYIESSYRLYQIDQIVAEYRRIAAANSRDNVLIYALGLALSYQATAKAELGGDPDGFNPKLLAESSATIARALSFDYALVEGYLTIAYNYEMMEHYLTQQESKPKSILSRLYESIVAPPLSLYRTITFYRAGKPPRYAERAIHELTKALALNDERKNPTLEATIALNLANNYYQLGEYGLERAYEYYLVKLKYDSTFIDRRREALVYERLGHASLIAEDYQLGPRYLQHAIDLYRDLEMEDEHYICTKRLALLYQDSNQPLQAINCFSQAAEFEEKHRFFNEQMMSLRSIAYNYLLAGKVNSAIDSAQRALDLIDSGHVQNVDYKPKRIKLGFLGLYAPLPFIDLTPAGAASVNGFSTRDERALIYSILGSSYRELKTYAAAIDYMQKKLQLNDKNQDPQVRATFFNNLGYLHFLDGNFSQARINFERSLSLCKENKLNYGWITNCVNLCRLIQSEKNQRWLDSRSDASWITYEMEAVAELREAIGAIQGMIGLQEEVVRAQLELGELLLTAAQDKILQSASGDLAPAQRALQQFTDARQVVQQALTTSLRRGMSREECTANFTLGRISGAIGDLPEAYQLFLRSRWLALNYGYFDILWRVDCFLGDLIDQIGWQQQKELGISVHPLEYYAEAIEVLETQAVEADGLLGVELRQTRKTPFLREAQYLWEMGLDDSALDAIERLHQSRFRDLLFATDLQLADKRSDELLQTARNQQNEIHRLQLKILQTELVTKNRAELRQELNNQIDTFEKLVAVMRRDAPRLESLLSKTPTSVATVQQLLDPGDAVLCFYDLERLMLSWLVTADEVIARPLSLSRRQIEEAFAADDAQSQQSLRELFAPVLQRSKVQQLVLIPDPAFLLYPWTNIWRQADSLHRPLFLLSSLSSLQASMENRKQAGKHIYITSQTMADRIASLGYTPYLPVQNPDQNSFVDQLEYLRNADIFHLSLQTEWNVLNPTVSKLGFFIRNSLPAVFEPTAFLSFRSNAGLAVLQFEQSPVALKAADAFLLLERALYFSGVSGLLVVPQAGKEADEFLYHFYQAYQDLPPAQAFDQAVEQRGVGIGQLYGFFSSRQQELERLSTSQILSALERAEQLSREHRWNEAVIVFEQALANEETTPEQQVGILNGLRKAAIISRNWRTAVESQNALLQRAQQSHNRAAIASAWMSLAVLHRSHGDAAAAKAAEEKYRQFAVRYGLHSQAGEAYFNLAQTADCDRDGSLAVEWFEQAQSRFRASGDRNGVLRCQIELARIAMERYHDSEIAIDPLTVALKESAVLKDTSMQVRALRLRAQANENLGNLHAALTDRQNALLLLEKKSLPDQLASTYFDLAHQHYKMKDIRVDYLQKALQLGDENIQLKAEFLFAKIDLQQHDYVSAAERVRALRQRLSGYGTGDLSELEAQIQLRQGFVQQALLSLQRAVDADSIAGADRFDRLVNLACLAKSLSDLKTASQAANSCQERARITQDPLQNLIADFVVLHVEEKNRDPHQTAQEWRRVAEQATALWIPEIAWRSKLKTALSLSGSGVATADLYDQAFSLLESSEEALPALWILRELEPAEKLLHQRIGELISRKEMKLAWTLSDRAMAIGFKHQLGSRPFVFADSLAAKSWQTLIQAQQSFNRMQFQILQNVSRNSNLLPSDRESTALVQQRQKVDQAGRDFSRQQPAWAELGGGASPDVAMLQEHLPERTVLLKLDALQDDVFVWALAKPSIRGVWLRFAPGERDSLLLELGRKLDHQENVDSDLTDWSTRLLQPLNLQWEEFDQLLVVTNGSLANLPLTALPLPAGPSLGERLAINYYTSLPLLFERLVASEGSTAEIGEQPMVLLIDNTIQLSADAMRNRYQVQAIAAIENHYPVVEIRSQDDFSLPEIKGAFYLSWNAVSGDKFNPFLSVVPLPGPSGEVGLSAYEAIRRGSAAPVVVLPAADGIGGFAQSVWLRSLAAGGVASLILGEKSNDPMSSYIFAKRFFQFLAEGNSAAQACMRAQRIIRLDVNDHPSEWSRFRVWNSSI